MREQLRTDVRPRRAIRALMAAALALAVAGADQLTKAVVRAALSVGITYVPLIPGVLSFSYVENTGVAFGLASGFGQLFVVLAAVVIVATAIYLARAPLVSRLEVAGLGLVCGGAVGNAIDRALQGFVTDFISVELINFPVFNVADIGITVGVVMALVGFLFLSPANAPAPDASVDDARRVPSDGGRGEESDADAPEGR